MTANIGMTLRINENAVLRTGTMGLLPRKAAMVSVSEKRTSIYDTEAIIVDVVVEADGTTKDRILMTGLGEVL